jgi:hypothetical protein
LNSGPPECEVEVLAIDHDVRLQETCSVFYEECIVRVT